MKIKTTQVIEVAEWDKVVQDTYKRPYSLQQQDGCHDRGNLHITVPCECQDLENDTVPEKVNDPEMGVSFKAWLERDPRQYLAEDPNKHDWCINMWWERNFYPLLDVIANDLYDKGLLAPGEYTINIDW